MRAQKLNQHPAVAYDMGNRDFVIKRNKCCYENFLRCFAVSSPTQYSQQTSVKNAASIRGALACLSHIIRHKLQEYPLTLRWKNDGYATKKLKVHGLKCK